MKLLPDSFYVNDDVVHVARQLIGKIIKTSLNGVETSGRIVETEAYRGKDDKGCHSFIHGKTERTSIMFEKGGVAYVYICYGMHHMINVVTNQKEYADAVLIRAIEPIIGRSEMVRRRKLDEKNHVLSGGPGKVCQCLGIDKSLNGQSFYSKSSPIQLFEDNFHAAQVVVTPRVGMSKRVAEFANAPWRFYIKNNPFVSRPLTLHYSF